MENSQKFGFNLPSRDIDDLVDVNLLSDNFIIIDYMVLSKDEIETKINNALGNVETALDGIIAIQNSLIGGDSEWV